MSCIPINLCLFRIDNEPWGIFVEIIIFFYCFAGLAIVCDKYLVPSIETLCLRGRIREDVAGASLMALGSSAPELVITIVGVIQGEADLGVGVSFGSGMIAFSILPALCAFSTDRPLALKRRPLARDVFFYCCSICCLTAFFADGYVELWESACMIGLYMAFLLTVIFSPSLRKSYLHYNTKSKYQKRLKAALDTGASAEEIEVIKSEYQASQAERKSFVLIQKEEKERRLALEAEEKKKQLEKKSERQALVRHSKQTASLSTVIHSSHIGYGANLDETDHIDSPATPSTPSALPSSPVQPSLTESDGDERSSAEVPPANGDMPMANGHLVNVPADSNSISSPDDTSLSNGIINETAVIDDTVLPKEDGPLEIEEIPPNNTATNRLLSQLSRIYLICTRPLTWLIDHTCIDADHECRTANWYPFTMFVSFVWVALFAFSISTIAGRWNVRSGLPLSLFGIVLVSIGAVTPDCVGSIAVSKRGYGSMAMSNGVGGQVTNSLIGLGLPFFIHNLQQEIEYQGGTSDDNPITKGIALPEHANLFIAACFQICNVVHFISILLLVALFTRNDKATLSKKKAYSFLGAYAFVILGYTLTSLLVGEEKEEEILPIE